MSYTEYYQRAIDRGVNGYKSVAGGTGIGKTHGAVECIKANKETCKFIYVSHRHNLLEEMGIKLSKEKINYRYVRGDTDIMRLLLGDDEKLKSVKRLIKDPIFKEYAEYMRSMAKESHQWRSEEKTYFNLISEARRILDLESSNPEGELDVLNPTEEL